jgi:hypothetical protein
MDAAKQERLEEAMIVTNELVGNPFMPRLAPNQQKMAVEKGLLVLRPGITLPRPKYSLEYEELLAPGSWIDDSHEYDAYMRDAYTEKSIDGFILLAAYYQKAAEVYFLRKLRLDIVEQQLLAADIGYPVIATDRISIFQERSALKLKTLYIRISSCHLEYLSADDITILRRLYSENGIVIDDRAMELISRTVTDVVVEYDEDGERYPKHSYVGFYGGSSGVSYDPNAVIIVFPNCEVFTEDGSLTDFEEQRYFQRREYLFNYLPKIQAVASRAAGMPVMIVITEGALLSYPEWEYISHTIDNDRGINPKPQER